MVWVPTDTGTHIGAANGQWVEGPQRDKQLPRIPSLPLSARNAAAILKQLGGPEAPRDWQGGLPLTYRIGPGPVTLDMDVQNDERVDIRRTMFSKELGSKLIYLQELQDRHAVRPIRARLVHRGSPSPRSRSRFR